LFVFIIDGEDGPTPPTTPTSGWSPTPPTSPASPDTTVIDSAIEQSTPEYSQGTILVY